MGLMQGLVPGFFAAVLVQPFVFLCRVSLDVLLSWLGGATQVAEGYVRFLKQMPMLSFYVIVVAAAFVLVLGVPSFVTLKRLNKLSWWSVSGVGFLAAAVPSAIYAWPLWVSPGFSAGGNWYGTYVEFVKNGVPTLFGWLSYVEGTFWFGVQGLFGATAFYWAWLKSHEPQQGVPADRPRPAGSAGG